MVTCVPNKLIKVTRPIIVDISVLGFIAHCMRPTRYQSAVQSPFALETRCAFVIRFSQSGLKLLFLFFHAWNVRRVCVTVTSLGQRKENEFRACALLVPNARLALVWRSSKVYIPTRKNAHIFEDAETACAQRLTHTINEWRSSGVLVKSSANSDAQPANHNALTKILHF